jgi:hypothetical protein
MSSALKNSTSRVQISTGSKKTSFIQKSVCLSSYSAQRRTNEVGIRKVMGADSFTLIYTLAREFPLRVLN